ncbi:MAG TPA: sigma 54-interacting transcriptional regulator, partial [Polyangiaceae bacterium]|nr:sigma 54-interacting transcriptional regulator [Polyangiaceae bacterium]
GAELDTLALARRAATSARIRLAAGAPEQALALVADAPRTAATLEARALAELALGARTSAWQSLERAEALATGVEERARLAAVAGSIAHAAGDAQLALERFRSAAAQAAHAGAVLEEASYLTGVAAAASNTGDLADALGASRRAILLFEALGRAPDAARAALSRASAFLAAGALEEARDAALDALARARLARDTRCEAYVELCCADLASDRGEARGHASRAESLLAEAAPEDTLWVKARLLRSGAPVDTEACDANARLPNVPIEARLEWWAARAQVESEQQGPGLDTRPLAELAQLAGERAPRATLGAALASGIALARRAGQGELARKLLASLSDAARELLRRAPPELRSTLGSLAWVRLAEQHAAGGVIPEQVGDVERLVRALARRGALQPLLNDVLDALVLWTGVERGLLLLRAPGGKLVPRAARNLARRDLPPEQLSLSRTLAERALAERQPVIAVDASRELPEVFTSVHALKLRSVLALPLLARGEAFGVVYLDDRVRSGAFGARELAWVHLIASLAAVAIADARDQLLLRRAARRAERAERRLAAELAERQLQLELAERELARTREGRETRFAYDELIGGSSALRNMLQVVDRVTASDVPVLLQGESGSGKELVARAIHRNGPRGSQAFVSENCGAIPETLLETTLFGHVRGAFTGANRPRAGLFEIADRGTLFLDEIAEMSLAMQTKLLRVLEEGEFRPVGAERARRVDVRVIGATHRDLEARVAAAQFREDLFYRLNVIRISVPPLRERHGDVPLLIRYFLERHAPGRKVRVSKPALHALTSYSWPGNIRQLENEIRRALVLADSLIELAHLSPEVCDRRRGEQSRASGLNVRERIDALEAELVSLALRRTQGNQTKAAELLGLSRFGLQKMMKRLDISPLYARIGAK